MKRIILLTILAMFIAVPIMAQEVTTTIGIASGNIMQSTNFSEYTNVDNVRFYEDGYQSTFRFINANATFSHSFTDEGVSTEFAGTGTTLRGKEVISGMQVDTEGILCYGAAAGVKFHMTGIDYKTMSSPGSCNGVNFSLESSQGDGRISSESIYRELYEEKTDTEDGSTVVGGNVFYKTNIGITGVYNNFNTMVVANPCPVGEEPPKTPIIDPDTFSLCNGWFPTP